MLEQGDVAGHERGRDKAEDLPEWEVPGHNGQDDAERVPADVAVLVFCRDGLFGQDARCIFGVVAAGGGALEDLGAGAGESLTHLLGEHSGELFDFVLENAGELAHAERAVLEGDFEAGAKGGLGDGDLGLDGVFSERLERAEDFTGRGIER